MHSSKNNKRKDVAEITHRSTPGRGREREGGNCVFIETAAIGVKKNNSIQIFIHNNNTTKVITIFKNEGERKKDKLSTKHGNYTWKGKKGLKKREEEEGGGVKFFRKITYYVRPSRCRF